MIDPVLKKKEKEGNIFFGALSSENYHIRSNMKSQRGDRLREVKKYNNEREKMCFDNRPLQGVCLIQFSFNSGSTELVKKFDGLI